VSTPKASPGNNMSMSITTWPHEAKCRLQKQVIPEAHATCIVARSQTARGTGYPTKMLPRASGMVWNLHLNSSSSNNKGHPQIAYPGFFVMLQWAQSRSNLPSLNEPPWKHRPGRVSLQELGGVCLDMVETRKHVLSFPSAG
jgi:hypothetical protein